MLALLFEGVLVDKKPLAKEDEPPQTLPEGGAGEAKPEEQKQE
jgi:hypothetical protein